MCTTIHGNCSTLTVAVVAATASLPQSYFPFVARSPSLSREFNSIFGWAAKEHTKPCANIKIRIYVYSRLNVIKPHNLLFIIISTSLSLSAVFLMICVHILLWRTHGTGTQWMSELATTKRMVQKAQTERSSRPLDKSVEKANEEKINF